MMNTNEKPPYHKGLETYVENMQSYLNDVSLKGFNYLSHSTLVLMVYDKLNTTTKLPQIVISAIAEYVVNRLEKNPLVGENFAYFYNNYSFDQQQINNALLSPDYIKIVSVTLTPLLAYAFAGKPQVFQPQYFFDTDGVRKKKTTPVGYRITRNDYLNLEKLVEFSSNPVEHSNLLRILNGADYFLCSDVVNSHVFPQTNEYIYGHNATNCHALSTVLLSNIYDIQPYFFHLLRHENPFVLDSIDDTSLVFEKATTGIDVRLVEVKEQFKSILSNIDLLKEHYPDITSQINSFKLAMRSYPHFTHILTNATLQRG